MSTVLWAAEELSLTIGRQIIYDDTAVAIYSGERCALVGRNGCGKSTLLKIITGSELPGGNSKITRAKNLRCAILPQDFELDKPAPSGKILQTVWHTFWNCSSNTPPSLQTPPNTPLSNTHCRYTMPGIPA